MYSHWCAEGDAAPRNSSGWSVQIRGGVLLLTGEEDTASLRILADILGYRFQVFTRIELHRLARTLSRLQEGDETRPVAEEEEEDSTR